jgi:hypothetical protein
VATVEADDERPRLEESLRADEPATLVGKEKRGKGLPHPGRSHACFRGSQACDQLVIGRRPGQTACTKAPVIVGKARRKRPIKAGGLFKDLRKGFHAVWLGLL